LRAENYAETSMLPFNLNSVQIYAGTFPHLLAVLSDVQRNAISTIRIYYMEVYRMQSYAMCVSRSHLAYLVAQLGGLKGVIVEGWKTWMSQEYMQDMLKGVKLCVEDHVQVEFEILD
jgi:hypothetical protein